MKTWMIVGLILSAVPAWAAGPTRHSGILAAVNRDAGTLIVEEVGPWRVGQGETVTTQRTFAVTSETRFARVNRVPEIERAATGWLGDYAETSLGQWAASPGEFVTVEATREGSRLTAVKVTVVPVGQP
jgi:hypothetical protein